MKSTTQKFLSFFILTFFLFLGFVNIAKAQFWTEDFALINLVPGGSANGYVGVNGPWTETLTGFNGADANKFFISCTEAGMQPNNCGAACPPVPLPPPTPFIGQSLHVGSVVSAFSPAFCPLGDCGSIYWAGFPPVSDASTEVRAESPTINCTPHTNIVLTFNYLEFGDASLDNAEVWYFDGVNWSLLLDMAKTSCGDGVGGPCNAVPCNGLTQGLWTASPNIALPASANNNPAVKIGFRWVNNNDGAGTDPSFAVTQIQLSSSVVANTITLGNLVGPFCAGATASLPFTSAGLYTLGNDYTAQLSDATGSFASPTDIGTLTSTANVGSIPLTFPANTPTGAGYLIQVVSSAPNATSATIGPFTINASVPLSATVSANPGSTICPGQCVTFNVAVTNGGITPTFQWIINGVNAPAPSTLDSLYICTLQPGDLVTVNITSSLSCVTNSPSNANGLVIQGLPVSTFSVSLTTNPNPFTICAGDTARMFAASVNGGPSPIYAWTVNNTLLPGINNDTLIYAGIPIPITNNTVICVIGASSIPGCVTNSPDTLCDTITVIPSVTPSVSIVADSTTICVGGTVVFTSTATNEGTNPTYQWFIGPNAVPAPQGTSSTFTATSLVPGDVVSLNMTSNASCLTTPTASSNAIAINVLPFETPSISIAPNAGICPGQSITFISTATGGGLSPQYQWFLNDTVLVGTGVNLTVNASIFVDNDTLTCNMISNYPCLLSDTAFSNAYNIQLLDPAQINLGDNVSIFYGESYKTDPEINGPVSLGDFLWSPDSTLSCNVCFNPVATPTITTPYVVFYQNSTGCIARDTINVEVKPNYEVFIPTGFSPNGDNINDVFYVRGPFVKSVNMKVWDRFGGVVFESPYINYGWDGTKNFKDLNTGIYIYYITVEFLDGVNKEFKGNITLSR